MNKSLKTILFLAATLVILPANAEKNLTATTDKLMPFHATMLFAAAGGFVWSLATGSRLNYLPVVAAASVLGYNYFDQALNTTVEGYDKLQLLYKNQAYSLDNISKPKEGLKLFFGVPTTIALSGCGILGSIALGQIPGLMTRTVVKALARTFF